MTNSFLFFLFTLLLSLHLNGSNLSLAADTRISNSLMPDFHRGRTRRGTAANSALRQSYSREITRSRDNPKRNVLTFHSQNKCNAGF